MQRASMTVVLKSGERYDANHIAVTTAVAAETDARGYRGMESRLSFVCSGQMTVKRAAEVERIEYRETGAQHCGECDGSIWGVVGAGIHANPEPLDVPPVGQPIGPVDGPPILHGHP